MSYGQSMYISQIAISWLWYNNCGTMRGIRFCGCGWVPVRGFLHLFWREISYETGRRRGKTRSQGSQQERGVCVSQKKVTVRERRLSSEELGLGDSEARLANARGWVSVTDGFVGISLGYTLVIATDTQKTIEKCQNFSLLALGANAGPYLLVLLSSTLDYICCVCCVFVKQCEIFKAGDERNH